MSLQSFAIRYAELGLAVFPCEPRGKRPLGRLAPNGSRSASHDPERVRKWWRQEPEANVAIATGAASRLLVVDLDGTHGETSFGELLARYGAPSDRGDDGATVRTGAGWHIWLRADDRVHNSAGKLAPGIDTRGEGGYVLAPPSVHPSGAVYTWRDTLRTPLPRPARWLLELLERPEAPKRPIAVDAPLVKAGGTPYGLAALEAAGRELLETPEGGRNDALNTHAFSIAQLVAGGELEEEGAREALRTAALAISLPEVEAEKTLESAWKAGLELPRQAPPAPRIGVAA